MEEDEDVLDLFADESDLLFSDTGGKVNGDSCQSKQEQTSETKPRIKPVDEATALVELPDYTPIEKDKSGSLDDDKIEDENITDQLESKIDVTLDEVIQSNQKREERKRHRFNSDNQEMHDSRNCKQRYMVKNGVQLCLLPRRDIAKLSPQDAGNELARCLDEVSVIYVYMCLPCDSLLNLKLSLHCTRRMYLLGSWIPVWCVSFGL